MPRIELGSALADRVRGPLGIEQIVVLVDPEVFAQHREAQLTSKPAGSVPEPAGIDRGTLVAFGVHHRGGQLGVVRPGPRVEVVAAHRCPDVVDDAQLGVHVDGQALQVLDIEHLNPVPARLPHHGQGLRVPQHRRLVVELVLVVGPPWHDGDQMQSGRALECGGEDARDVERPQVLVLEVDQPLGSADRLGVGQGDAAFPLRGIRVARSTARVGPQELDRAGTGGRWVG
jgi:hypothetical protein